jgi:hypothetical protein
MAETIRLYPQGEQEEMYKDQQAYVGREVDVITEQKLKEFQKTAVDFKVKLMSEHLEVMFNQDLGDIRQEIVKAYEQANLKVEN